MKSFLLVTFSFILSILCVVCQVDESVGFTVAISNVSESVSEDNLTLSEALRSSSLYDLSYPTEHLREVDVISSGRLPRNLLPYHYNLSLKPVIGAEPPFRFWGRVYIHFECVQNTSFLVIDGLHHSIVLPSVSIYFDQNNDKSLAAPVLGSSYKSNSKLIFYMRSGFIEGGKYVFKADFSRRMSSSGKGLYWAEYINKYNVTRYVASTHFQPVGAHTTFPCFDEIDMKSTFNISIIRKTNHISLSNMPLIRTVQLSDDWFEDYFDTTPRMSTYLVCMTVGQFEEIPVPSHPETNISVSLYAVDSQIDYLGYVAEHVETLLKWFYENVFHPYREPKIDHVAIPFRLAAMENWGLITYSEDILCISNETSSVSGKIRMLSIVSHEIAHMRFGNLVTCKWWTDLWINEGIATYFNFLPMEALGIESSQLQQARFVDGVQHIMTLDEKNNSRQVIRAITNPVDSFSPIVYYKTAAILRHVQGIVSRTVLFRVLERFLEKYAFSNADTQDFIDVIDEHVALNGVRYPDGAVMDFEVILTPWLSQIGFPLVTTSRINGSFVRASQSHYFNPRNQSTDSMHNHSWEIPMTLVGGKSGLESWKGRPTHWIHINETSTLVNISEVGDGWYILNPNQVFYYRVLYDEENRKKLVEQLCSNYTAIPVETRAQLIDDMFNLARNSYLNVSDALQFILYLGAEEEYNPWEATLHHINTITCFFEDEPFFDIFENYMMNLLDHLLDKLGYEFRENETVSKSLLRALAIPAACGFGSSRCLDHVRSLFKSYISEPYLNSLDPNVLPAVLCWGVYEGTVDDWQMIYDQYQVRKNSPIKTERMAYLQALVCSRNTTLLDKIYDDILKGTFRHYSLFASSKYLSQKFWEFIRGSGRLNVRKLKPFEVIIEKWYSEEHLRQLKEFELTDPDVEQQVIQSILQVESNMEFRENNREPFRRWLSDVTQASNEVLGGYLLEEVVEVMADDPLVQGRGEFRAPRWTDWNRLDNDLFSIN